MRLSIRTALGSSHSLSLLAPFVLLATGQAALVEAIPRDTCVAQQQQHFRHLPGHHRGSACYAQQPSSGGALCMSVFADMYVLAQCLSATPSGCIALTATSSHHCIWSTMKVRTHDCSTAAPLRKSQRERLCDCSPSTPTSCTIPKHIENVMSIPHAPITASPDSPFALQWSIGWLQCTASILRNSLDLRTSGRQLQL